MKQWVCALHERSSSDGSRAIGLERLSSKIMFEPSRMSCGGRAPVPERRDGRGGGCKLPDLATPACLRNLG